VSRGECWTGRWQRAADWLGDVIGGILSVCQIPAPADVIAGAARWYLRYGLSYRDAEELLGDRGVLILTAVAVGSVLAACGSNSAGIPANYGFCSEDNPQPVAQVVVTDPSGKVIGSGMLGTWSHIHASVDGVRLRLRGQNLTAAQESQLSGAEIPVDRARSARQSSMRTAGQRRRGGRSVSRSRCR
jgi:hypothetical protein